MEESIQLMNGDCLELMKDIPDGSVDVILTDPPYKYLKNQKLEVDFDEELFFANAKRILKKGGFIILFGRGVSFYRWNCILDSLGFTFKEEVIWDKSYCTSPLMAMSRVHETVSIFSKGKGVIRKVRVPYLEQKKYNIASIINDIKRIASSLGNVQSLESLKTFLETNEVAMDGSNDLSTTISSKIKCQSREVSTMALIQNGLKEKSIIRSDYSPRDTYKDVTVNNKIQNADRAVNTFCGINYGLKEKSIIKELRDHYKTIHPTQKPVRLLERLLNLVAEENCLVLDPFMGSGSTGIACLNTNRKFIGIELDVEYYKLAEDRLNSHSRQTKLF